MDFVPPTEEEISDVEILKDRVKNTTDEDVTPELISELSEVTYLRFYRGRKRIIDDCYNSLISHLKWRKKCDVANFESFEIKNEVESKKSIVVGTDKQMHPVIYVFARRHDKYNRDVDEITRFIIWTINTALKNSVPSEEQVIIVFDLTNFGLRCMDYEAVKILIAILAHNYPEILATVHIVNHPWLFNACWAVIRPWIDPVTAEKVNFTAVADLPEYIAKEDIPADVGDYSC